MTKLSSKTKSKPSLLSRSPQNSKTPNTLKNSSLSKDSSNSKSLNRKAADSAAKKLLRKLPPKVEFQFVLKELKKNYPDAHCALVFHNPFELLIATMLSAQCTDERVNMVTAVLFKKFPTPKAVADASIDELEEIVRPTGFFRNKAKNVKQCAEIVVSKYKSRVPQTMDELYELPGVGRKTANVVLGNAFNIASGVVVDTHVTRLSNRLGWVRGTDAVDIEQKLNDLCPQEDWIMLSHYLISHGRAICKARNPQCEKCFLQSSCPKLGV